MAGILSIRSGFRFAKSLKHISRPALGWQCCRKISSFRKKSDSSIAEPIKSDYAIELDRVTKEDNYEEYMGFDDTNPFLDKLSAHLVMFMGLSMSLVFVPFLYYMGPDKNHRMLEWKLYEAAKLIEEREARGELPLDCNFAPPELIESMVPPAGDWEEEWLRSQPAVATKCTHPYFYEVPTW